MTFVDGYLLAVPASNKAKYIEMANGIDGFFMKHGALRMVECWEVRGQSKN